LSSLVQISVVFDGSTGAGAVRHAASESSSSAANVTAKKGFIQMLTDRNTIGPVRWSALSLPVSMSRGTILPGRLADLSAEDSGEIGDLVVAHLHCNSSDRFVRAAQ
jgi:hypothetical protein